MVLGVEGIRHHRGIGDTCPGRARWYAQYRDRRPVKRRGEEGGVSSEGTRRMEEEVDTLLQVGERQLGG